MYWRFTEDETVHSYSGYTTEPCCANNSDQLKDIGHVAYCYFSRFISILFVPRVRKLVIKEGTQMAPQVEARKSEIAWSFEATQQLHLTWIVAV
jgi:hypothetical protein